MTTPTPSAHSNVTSALEAAPAILLMGAPGGGKTYSLTTLLDAGLELFVIITEPNGLETLIDTAAKKNLDISKIHVAIVAPTRPGFAGLANLAKTIASGTFETLAKLPPSAGRNQAQMHRLLSILSNFVDERTGESFGPVDEFGPDRALIIDSLSGLNIMAMDLAIGDKPTAHQGEWGVAMGYMEKLLHKLTGDLKCLFVLTAHIEREQDEVTGGSKNMVGILGRKLAPKVPRFFSEVVLAHRSGNNYFWSTSEPTTDLKSRSLPLGDKLPPSFGPIVAAYKTRMAALRK